jgi:hypothetical protein
MYLVLSKDPNNLVLKINKVINELRHGNYVIRNFTETPLQPELIKVVPIWKQRVVTHSGTYSPTLNLALSMSRAQTESTNVIAKFEVYINSNLYKEMLKKTRSTYSKCIC